MKTRVLKKKELEKQPLDVPLIAVDKKEYQCPSDVVLDDSSPSITSTQL